MPDRYESGTLNAPGIVGLLEGVKYIKLIGIEEIYGHEMQLTKQLIEGLSVIPKVKILCPGAEKRVSTVSIVIDGMDCNEVAMRLDEEYDVAVRSGNALRTHGTQSLWYATKRHHQAEHWIF